MSNFTYAELDANGDVRRVHVHEDELTAEQMGEMGLIPYVQDPYDHDEATTKIVGEEIVVIDGTAHKRAIFAPKDSGDYYRDAVAMRESVLPAPAERDEAVWALLNRIIAWIALQAEPGKPETVFQITPPEVALLDQMDATFAATPLPADGRMADAVAKKL